MIFVIAAADASELRLIRDSWRQSFRRFKTRWGSRRMSNADYNVWVDAHMESVLSRFPLLLVARSEGVVLGWVCAEGNASGMCVHYVYVKGPRREQGVGKALVRAALYELGPASGEGRYYTARTFAEPTAKAWGFEYVEAWP